MTQFKEKELASATLFEAETESTNFTEKGPDPEETNQEFQENLI